MPSPIETTRLLLRPLTQSNYDFNFLRSLHLNPEVMKYIGTSGIRTEEQTKAGIEKCLLMEKENPLLGAWIANEKDTSLPIGNLILRIPATDQKTEGLEIGFSFLPEHWGKGFATEASRGIIDYVKKNFENQAIVALIDPQNKSSRHTLTKLGFKPAGETLYVESTTGNKIPTEILKLQI